MSRHVTFNSQSQENIQQGAFAALATDICPVELLRKKQQRLKSVAIDSCW